MSYVLIVPNTKGRAGFGASVDGLVNLSFCVMYFISEAVFSGPTLMIPVMLVLFRARSTLETQPPSQPWRMVTPTMEVILWADISCILCTDDS
jgi:hypothetical protein